MRVEIIEGSSKLDLEIKLNNKLMNYTDEDIKDIKYGWDSRENSCYSNVDCSAMIIYK